MATLTTQAFTDEDGGALTPVAASGGGDAFVWTEDTFLFIQNGSGAPITVTLTPVVTTGSVPGLGEVVRENIALAVAAGAKAIIPPPARAFRNAETGLVAVTYSGVTSLTVAAVRVGA
jgi:hypothetical protein